VALALEAALVPARKPGKLPWKRHRVEYELEYGTDAIEVHEDAIGEGHRVLIVDDVLATGGTAAAAARAVQKAGGQLIGLTFLSSFHCWKEESGWETRRSRASSLIPGRIRA
jgi:adenine phosphoribosyltransferase